MLARPPLAHGSGLKRRFIKVWRYRRAAQASRRTRACITDRRRDVSYGAAPRGALPRNLLRFHPRAVIPDPSSLVP